VAKKKDPQDVVASIQRSIEEGTKGSRRVRCHSLRTLFGFQAWTAQRKDFVAALLDARGIRAQPPISEAGVHDWIVLSLPSLPPLNDDRPDPRPSEEWFDNLTSVHLDSEREVEMYFASPLFHGLGYTSENEAAGFRFDMWEGVARRRVEADLVYFLDERHSLEDGVPLVLVEAKGTDQAPDAGTGQVRSYAFWLKPAYYVITNGEVIVVYNYQGGAVPDVKVLDIRRSSLREQFDNLYSVLNPKAANEARQAKLDRLKG
jgi:Type I restriction enzyme R protein N terminus (HSDR_N)